MKEQIQNIYVKAINEDLPPNVFADQVLCLFTDSRSVTPDVVASERKLREMAELHKPKIDNGKSDFYLTWRLCYEWISGTDR